MSKSPVKKPRRRKGRTVRDQTTNAPSEVSDEQEPERTTAFMEGDQPPARLHEDVEHVAEGGVEREQEPEERPAEGEVEGT
jgi:hypothetical protein